MYLTKKLENKFAEEIKQKMCDDCQQQVACVEIENGECCGEKLISHLCTDCHINQQDNEQINETNYTQKKYKEIIIKTNKLTSKLITIKHNNWQKHKRHQYKYLTEKLKFKYLDLKYREEVSNNTDPSLIKDEVNFYNEYYYRLDFYSGWLERINNKYNYKGVNNVSRS